MRSWMGRNSYSGIMRLWLKIISSRRLSIPPETKELFILESLKIFKRKFAFTKAPTKYPLSNAVLVSLEKNIRA